MSPNTRLATPKHRRGRPFPHLGLIPVQCLLFIDVTLVATLQGAREVVRIHDAMVGRFPSEHSHCVGGVADEGYGARGGGPGKARPVLEKDLAGAVVLWYQVHRISKRRVEVLSSPLHLCCQCIFVHHLILWAFHRPTQDDLHLVLLLLCTLRSIGSRCVQC